MAAPKSSMLQFMVEPSTGVAVGKNEKTKITSSLNVWLENDQDGKELQGRRRGV